MEELRLLSRSAPPPSPTLRDLLRVIFRQRQLLLISFLGIFVAVFVYGLVAPSYESEMKVLLRRGRVDPAITSIPSQSEFEREGITEEQVNSEAELLQDNEILRTVVRNDDLISEGRSWIWSLAGDDEEQQVARAVRRISRRLTVEPVRKAALITVSYDSTNPEKSAKVLRSLARAYLERHHQVQRPSGEFTFFDQQVAVSRHNLEAAELQLMEFARDQGVTSAAQERDIALQKLSDADADSRQTQVAITENLERIRALQSNLAVLPERATTQVRNSDNPQLLQQIKGRLLDLQLKRTELLTQFEPTYRLVQEVDAEIAQAKATIAAEENAPLRDQTSDLEPNHEWARAQLLRAQVEQSALAAHAKAEIALSSYYRELVQQLGDRAITQERLLNDLKGAEEKYLLYVNKREEARISDALDQGGILNVTIAEQPTVPALPKLSKASFALIGLILASVVSLGITFATDYLNPSFRTPDEVIAFLSTPVLASLPRASLVGWEARTRGGL